MSIDAAGSDFIAATQSSIKIWSSGSAGAGAAACFARVLRVFSITAITCPRLLERRISRRPHRCVKRTLVNDYACELVNAIAFPLDKRDVESATYPQPQPLACGGKDSPDGKLSTALRVEALLSVRSRKSGNHNESRCALPFRVRPDSGDRHRAQSSRHEPSARSTFSLVQTMPQRQFAVLTGNGAAYRFKQGAEKPSRTAIRVVRTGSLPPALPPNALDGST